MTQGTVLLGLFSFKCSRVPLGRTTLEVCTFEAFGIVKGQLNKGSKNGKFEVKASILKKGCHSTGQKRKQLRREQVERTETP